MTAAELARVRAVKLAQLVAAARVWRAAWLKPAPFEEHLEAEQSLLRAVDAYSAQIALERIDPDKSKRSFRYAALAVLGPAVAIALLVVSGCGGAAAAVDVEGAAVEVVTAESCRALLCPDAQSVEILYPLADAGPGAEPMCQCDCAQQAERVQWITSWPPPAFYVAWAQGYWAQVCSGGAR